MQLEIPIISHTDFDLSRFDFSFADIYLHEIRSKGFEDYIRCFTADEFEHNYNFVEIIKKEINFEHQKFYAVIKKDFQKNFSQRDISNVHKLLLIIFPSDLQISYELHFDDSSGFMQTGGMSKWNERTTGEYPGDYLILLDEYVDEANEFIKLAFPRLNNESYIGLAISHYLTSFESSHYHYQYVSLCMVLESVISGKSELTYRLRRNISILVGTGNYNCNKLYNNINKLYELRSSIVHGEDYNQAKISTYLPYLKSLASRVIIELIIHNYPKNKDLNHRITEIGFGSKSELSDNYKEFKLNISTYSSANWADI